MSIVETYIYLCYDTIIILTGSRYRTDINGLP